MMEAINSPLVGMVPLAPLFAIRYAMNEAKAPAAFGVAAEVPEKYATLVVEEPVYAASTPVGARISGLTRPFLVGPRAE